MSHVVLVYPKTTHNRLSGNIAPLGLLYVAAPLVRDGHHVTVIDQRLDSDWRAALARAVGTPRTVAVGVSSMTGAQIQHGLEMARAAREMAPEVPIVWGGVHPTLMPEQTIENELVDIIVVGEGEIAFSELVNRLSEGRGWDDVPGLCFRRDGRTVRNPPPPPVALEEIPPLPYEVLDLNQYRVAPLRSASVSLPIVTSRGCAFRCGYCYNTRFHSRSWRALSPETSVEQIRRLVEATGIGGIFLLDDNFFGNRGRARRILELLVESRMGLRIYNANCRVDFLRSSSEEYLKLVREAGIEQLFVGVESGSDAVLSSIAKDIKAHHVLEVNHKLREAGIVPVYSFMAGMPDETREDVQKTLELMVRLRNDNPQARMYKISLFVPMPGTPLFEVCRERSEADFPKRFEEWSTYDYDHANLSYLSGELKDFLVRASEISGFIDVKGKTSGSLSPLAAMYSGVVRLRVKHRWLGWMPEMGILRLARGMQRRFGQG